MTQKFHSCESIQEKWKCMTQTLYTNVQNSFMHRAKCPPRQEWETVMNIWCKLGQLLFLLDLCLWLGLVNEREGVLGDWSAGRRRVWGIFPFPSLLWHYGLGSNVSLRCPLRGVFLDSTEYSFSEANRGHTWSQSSQNNVRQETQQSSVRYPSSIGVFAAVHVITV